MDPTGQILIKAAELIARGGWTQVEWGYEGTKRCAYLAIADACEMAGDDRRLEARQRMIDMLQIKDDFSGVSGWNDVPGRTKEEVIDALIAAAYF